MQTERTLPVLTYATGNGWTTIGHARSAKGAERVIRGHLGDGSRSLLEKHRFTLQVFRRTEIAIEINGGPEGYVWSIGK